MKASVGSSQCRKSAKRFFDVLGENNTPVLNRGALHFA